MSATSLGLALAALSALGTAISHAMVKAGRDKLAVQVWIRLVGLGLALPFLLTSPPPDPALLGLRETSILIALAAGCLWLGERPGRWHWSAGIAIAAGAIIVVTAN